MPDNFHEPSTVALSLEPESHWTLHHVLLHRLEREARADDPSGIEPPPLPVFEAFETLDAGETRFTMAELEAVQTVLAEYHHSTTWWELERPRLEQLLRQVTERLGEHDAVEV
jgi:hypothetical protein